MIPAPGVLVSIVAIAQCVYVCLCVGERMYVLEREREGVRGGGGEG